MAYLNSRDQSRSAGFSGNEVNSIIDWYSTAVSQVFGGQEEDVKQIITSTSVREFGIKPAKVTYEFFILSSILWTDFLKCSERTEAYGTWCISECRTTRRASFLRGCLMKPFVRAFGALLSPNELTHHEGFKEYFLSRRKWLFGAMAATVRRFGRSSAREEGPKSYGVGVAIFAGPRSHESNTVVESQRTVPVTAVSFEL
jgi:hypothetical protein